MFPSRYVVLLSVLFFPLLISEFTVTLPHISLLCRPEAMVGNYKCHGICVVLWYRCCVLLQRFRHTSRISTSIYSTLLSCLLLHRVCSIRACSRTWRGSSVALFCRPASVTRSVYDMGLANIFPWLWSRKQQVPAGQPKHSHHIAGEVSYRQDPNIVF